MRKFILKILLFVVLLSAVLLLADRHLPYYWGNEGLVSKMNKVIADEYRYDTYFVGSSRMYRHIQPSLFDSLNNGKTQSFNLSYSGTKPPETYHFLKHFIEECSNNTKYIFAELSVINDLTEINRNSLRAKYCLDFQTYKTAFLACLQNKRYETAWNYTISYLNRVWKINMLESIRKFDGKTHYPQALGPQGDGYYGLEKEMTDMGAADSTFTKRINIFFADTTTLTKRYETTIKEYKKNKSTQPAAPANIAQINRLIQQAKRKDIHLIFVLPPRHPGLLSLYNALPESNKIDLCNPIKYPEFYMAKYTFDVGHFNSAGADLFTQTLAKNAAQIFLSMESNAN